MKTIKLPLGLGALRKLQFPHKLGILERIYGRGLARHGVQWISTSAGLDWKLDLSNHGHRWIVYGDYEGSAQVNWLRNWLNEGGLVVDSGANIGQMLIYFLASPKTKILCVEPVPNCVEWLNDCVVSGGFQDRVTIVNSLFDEEAGTTELKVAGEADLGEWSTIHTEWFKNRKTKIIQCEAVTFDSIVQEQNASLIRLWKLDVEGGEVRALYGARESLEKQKIEALLVEISRDNLDDVNSLLNQYNYRAYKLHVSESPSLVDSKHMNADCGGNCLYLPH